MTNHNVEDRMLRLTEVLQYIPVCKTAWYNGITAGIFPQPEKIGRSSFWKMSYIQSIIARNRENQPTSASFPAAQ